MLGVLLVQRGSRFIGFTSEGERTLDWARRIVADSRAMREEIKALKHGLTGQLRIAAIPTALAMVAALTTPYRARHPDVRFTIWSRTSIEVLTLLDNLEIDAGLTYLDNEPLGRVNSVPLYQERTSCSLRPTLRWAIENRSAGKKWRRCRCACSPPICRTDALSTGCYAPPAVIPDRPLNPIP